ncbi:SDR family oxidoreductase [Streptomyces sp. NPDC049040]|uniref:SDR family oxidoreductase n=1 Tax=Streptomyces sp. NPDC049040 TaxID=3365593 RepID=UPI003723ED29
MTILVTGSRGRVARTLLGLLHAQGHPLRAGSSDPGALDPPGGIPAVRCVLDDPGTFGPALEGVRSVFLYAGRSTGAATAFAEAAAAAGVRHIVLLSSSAVLEPGGADNLLAGHHAAVEAALSRGPVPATFLRPGDFAGNALRWARSIAATDTVRLPYPEAHTLPLHEDDLAEAAAAVLTAPEGHPAPAYTLSGPQSLTFREQADLIGEGRGRPVRVETVDPAEWKAASGIPAPYADALLDHWRAHDGTPLTPAAPLVDHPRTFSLWAAANAASFA